MTIGEVFDEPRGSASSACRCDLIVSLGFKNVCCLLADLLKVAVPVARGLLPLERPRVGARAVLPLDRPRRSADTFWSLLTSEQPSGGFG